MRNFTITDDFGRRTQFSGEKLVAESTDTSDGRKPQWLEVEVWRTAAGNFIVKRTTHYRLRHVRELCSRADGYDLVDATELDTYPCPSCNKEGRMVGGFAQSSRITVDTYTDPQDMIESFHVDGRYSNLARHILADIAEQDERIDELWNVVVVP